MKTPKPKTVLIVEDDAVLNQSMCEVARSAGFTVRACDTAGEALAIAAAFRPTVIFCDVHLSKGDGRHVLTSIRGDRDLGDCQFVLMTGDWVGAPARDSFDLEADAYLAKPFTLEEFTSCLDARYTQANL